MKSTLVVLALFIVGAYCKDSCPNFMYGTDCLDICGFCVEKGENTLAPCDKITGKCPSGECQPGWDGEDCKEPICNISCGSGKCIAPDVCFCGENVNTVGKTCSDIRIRGMMGSIAALAILTSSVALCGWGTKFFKKPGMPLLEDEEMWIINLYTRIFATINYTEV